MANISFSDIALILASVVILFTIFQSVGLYVFGKLLWERERKIFASKAKRVSDGTMPNLLRVELENLRSELRQLGFSDPIPIRHARSYVYVSFSKDRTIVYNRTLVKVPLFQNVLVILSLNLQLLERYVLSVELTSSFENGDVVGLLSGLEGPFPPFMHMIHLSPEKSLKEYLDAFEEHRSEYMENNGQQPIKFRSLEDYFEHEQRLSLRLNQYDTDAGGWDSVIERQKEYLMQSKDS